MTKKHKFILFIISVIIAGTYSYYNYYQNVSKHNRLLTFGKRSLVEARYYYAGGTGNFNFYFVTYDKRKIEGNRKCGSEGNCAKYINDTILYNPINPMEYAFLTDYNYFSYKYQFVFFFLICLPLMTFMLFLILRFVLYVYLQTWISNS